MPGNVICQVGEKPRVPRVRCRYEDFKEQIVTRKGVATRIRGQKEDGIMNDSVRANECGQRRRGPIPPTRTSG